ncbi:MAG: prolyl oligopeptidase family serine peptidase [Ferruginibacter sp.]
MKYCFISILLLSGISLFGQNKKPIDHTVYDGWRSVGDRLISNDGNYVVYNINAQEGDGELVIQHIKTKQKKMIPRGYAAVITDDSRYAVFKIKPLYQDTRQAKIKKKSADDMPRDSLGIVTLGEDSVIKITRVRSFKTPLKAAGWLAYQMEKTLPDTSKSKSQPDSVKARIDMLTKLADSLIRRSLDSIKGNIEKEEVITAAKKAVKEIYKKADETGTVYQLDADGDNAAAGGGAEGTDLIVRNLASAAEKTFKLVSEYLFDEKATKLLIRTTKNAKDTNSKAYLLIYDLQADHIDTIMKGLNDAKNFSFDEQGKQLAFVAERDSSSKALQKFYKLWYHETGQDTATILADKNTIGMQLGSTVSENGTVIFSKDGMKIFFGVAPIQPPKDTTLVDFELAQVDVWHYNDDYLQPQQLKQLTQEQKRNYTAVIKPGATELVQLGSEDAENISLVDEGNASWVMAQSTKNNRRISQWEGRTRSTVYMVNTTDGRRKLVKASSLGFFSASPKGKFIYWYDPEQKNYFTYNTTTGDTKNITSRIKVPLYDTENDVPDLPGPVGTTGWIADDRYFLVNDEYDIWKVDPTGSEQPKNLTNGSGRYNSAQLSYIKLDREKRWINPDEKILLQSFNKLSKYASFYTVKVNEVAEPTFISGGPCSYPSVLKAKNVSAYLLQISNISESELFAGDDLGSYTKLTDLATQQKDYNWVSAELVRWKMFDGKWSEGLLFKPENFDPKKKYPIIFYFYERDADGLYNYRAPAPSASTINIPYFVSNEYLVFDPNIYYKTGEPGESAYNSVVSAAKYFSKMPWVDSTRMAIQGQSWGGYQVAYLVTRTNIFRAAGAGAPVSNMTSAYGGIRWGSGLNRQFQYEKQQSRIGATLWQRPDLYLKNSPLFNADKVTTPLLIMHNDADGSVPWYQGIEYFTALRRLGKKVWLLEYNGEDHNLVERKNRKDLSVRLGQFFDYYLKDAKPANWIKYGLPAVDKGKDWGLKVE